MEIKGIIAAMATAMHDDGSINEQEIRRQVNRHIAAGVDGVFCLGTNGEFYILSAEEKKQVMEAARSVQTKSGMRSLVEDLGKLEG